MKLKNRLVAGVVAACALTAGAVITAAPANATTQYPERGTWNYAVAGYPGTTYSNYHQPSRYHRSTACNTSFCQRSADVSPATWSYASVRASVSNNRAYYYNY